jgi:hypothetical protein
MTEQRDEHLRSLLEDVAAGRLDPQTAVNRLDTPPPATPPWPGAEPHSGVRALAPPIAGAPKETLVERVVLSVAAGKVVVVGDPTVTTAEAQGPVVATREGDALKLDNRPINDSGFSFEHGDVKSSRPWRRWRDVGNPETITVRMNPELLLELSVAAGSAQVTGLRGGLKFRVDAGSLRVFDGAGLLEGRVASGAAQIEWLMREGAGHLRAELGSLKVRVLPGSDVTVSARAEMGSVELGSSAVRGEDGRRRVTVGAGKATLDIDVDLGSAKVATP